MLQVEIERLQKEGLKQVEQEQEYVRQQLIQEKLNKENGSHHVLRVRWSVAKDDLDNGGYSSELLHTIFSKVA
jgi:hypothetical protein